MWREKLALIGLTITAIPIALVVMHGAQSKLPAELSEVQEVFGPTMSTIAWVLCGLTALLSLVAIIAQGPTTRSIIARRGAQDDPAKAKGARVGAFLVAASLTQVPPLLSVAIYVLGAGLLPVGLGVAVSSLAVCVLGARM